jgi:demethylmenaquinone methyltransferase/2-methoxy-6-polyprenyl-1,4-benzoquinol methylase
MNEKELQKQAKVGRMFNSIAPKYDFLNHLLSFGIDFIWRRRLIRKLMKSKPAKVLDLACGTGDLSLLAAKKGVSKVVGVDISPGMLLVGRDKVKHLNLDDKIEFVEAAAENLPFENDVFDASTVAFGVRNYANLLQGLSETKRVLKPGAKIFILEFSQPKIFPIKQLYWFYSKFIMPFIGKLISKDNEAYKYLPETAAKFPSGEKFLEILKEAGYKNLESQKLSFGIASIYTAQK